MRGAYYNELDPYAAQWLRNLIAAGHIAAGDVDERSLIDVRADDLVGYTQCHFFAGIGVWSYALRRAGWRDDEPVWTGSCPCQPFSAAGKQEGTADARHLWPEWFRLIREHRPVAIFGEQVSAAIRHGWLDLVSADLEGLDYAVGSAVVGAHSVGAPHIRQRLFFVADSGSGASERDAGSVLGAQAEVGRQDGPQHGDLPFGHSDGGATGKLADSDSARCGQGRSGEAGDGTRQTRVEPSGLCVAGKLADSDGRNPGAEGLQRGGEHGQQPQDGGVGVALGDTEQQGLEGHDGNGNDRNQPGRVGTDEAGSTAAAGRSSFWSACDWLPCIDGKARPVEPGTFPLVTGASSRVGRLRAYGNSIVAPAAEEFIAAYMETRRAA